MVELLRRYLVVHKSLGIPGIGNFYFQRHKATFDFNRKVFTAPHFQIAFKDSPTAGDKHLYEFIAKSQHMEYVDAIEQFNQLSASLKTELNEQKTLKLYNIGNLTINTTGQLEFKPDKFAAVYFPEVMAERVARDAKQGFETLNVIGQATDNGTKKEVLVVEKKEERREREIPEDERWWLAALILALIAMAAIFYYYYTNGSLE